MLPCPRFFVDLKCETPQLPRSEFVFKGDGIWGAQAEAEAAALRAQAIQDSLAAERLSGDLLMIHRPWFLEAQ